MQYKALEWLYTKLKRKRIALLHAEKRKGCTEREKNDIQSDIDILEYIIGVVTAKGDE